MKTDELLNKGDFDKLLSYTGEIPLTIKICPWNREDLCIEKTYILKPQEQERDHFDEKENYVEEKVLLPGIQDKKAEDFGIWKKEIVKENVPVLYRESPPEIQTLGEENSKKRTRKLLMKRDLTLFLDYMGIPASVSGYDYLRDAIIMAGEDSTVVSSVTKLLYPDVAKKYHSTSAKVERNIRHAIDLGFKNRAEELKNTVFKFCMDNDRKRPTNSEFIAIVADKLRLKYEIID